MNLSQKKKKIVNGKKKPYKKKKLTNRQLEMKRRKRYHDIVWKGWRETDGKTYEVKTYNISEIDNLKEDK